MTGVKYYTPPHAGRQVGQRQPTPAPGKIISTLLIPVIQHPAVVAAPASQGSIPYHQQVKRIRVFTDHDSSGYREAGLFGMSRLQRNA